MSDQHLYMVFGSSIALAGFWLAATARSGEGKTVVKIFGAEITLAAAGGIIVMFLGISTFALPLMLQLVHPTAESTSTNPADPHPSGKNAPDASGHIGKGSSPDPVKTTPAAPAASSDTLSSRNEASKVDEQIRILNEKNAEYASEIATLKKQKDDFQNFIWTGSPRVDCAKLLAGFSKIEGAEDVNLVGSGDGVFFKIGHVNYGVVCRQKHLIGQIITSDKDAYRAARDWLRGELDKYSAPE